MTFKYMAEIKGLINGPFGDHLAYLAGRWSDEHEYEDFKDYEASMASKLPEPFKAKSFSKRPFGVTCALHEHVVRVTATAGGRVKVEVVA